MGAAMWVAVLPRHVRHWTGLGALAASPAELTSGPPAHGNVLHTRLPLPETMKQCWSPSGLCRKALLATACTGNATLHRSMEGDMFCLEPDSYRSCIARLPQAWIRCL